MSWSRLALIVVAAAVLGLSACGGGSDTTISGAPPDEVTTTPTGPSASGGGTTSPSTSAFTDPSNRPDLPASPESASSPLPAVTVWDLTADRWVQFADFLPADKPLLVWFWAPH